MRRASTLALVACLIVLVPAAPSYGKSRCRKVPRATVEARSAGVEPGLTVGEARAVRSKDFERAYFVSIELDGRGLEDAGDVATWVTNRLKGGGSIFSVGTIANEFSDWGDGGTTDAAFSLSDDGAQESQDCL